MTLDIEKLTQTNQVALHRFLPYVGYTKELLFCRKVVACSQLQSNSAGLVNVLHKLEECLLSIGQKQPYPVDATDYELVDIFNWQEEQPG